jgi:hypothetical protein
LKKRTGTDVMIFFYFAKNQGEQNGVLDWKQS